MPKDKTISESLDTVKNKKTAIKDIDSQLNSLRTEKSNLELDKRNEVTSMAESIVKLLDEDDLTLFIADTLNKAKQDSKCLFLSLKNANEQPE